MFQQKFITVRKNVVACIYTADTIIFRTSKNGDALKTLSAEKAAEVVADLKGFDAKSILTAAFDGIDLVTGNRCLYG